MSKGHPRFRHVARRLLCLRHTVRLEIGLSQNQLCCGNHPWRCTHWFHFPSVCRCRLVIIATWLRINCASFLMWLWRGAAGIALAVVLVSQAVRYPEVKQISFLFLTHYPFAASVDCKWENNGTFGDYGQCAPLGTTYPPCYEVRKRKKEFKTRNGGQDCDGEAIDKRLCYASACGKYTSLTTSPVSTNTFIQPITMLLCHWLRCLGGKILQTHIGSSRLWIESYSILGKEVWPFLAYQGCETHRLLVLDT